MDPTEEELFQWISSLPLSVQQSMMQYMLAGGDPSVGGTAPFGAGPMNTGRLGGQIQGPLNVSPFDPMSVGAAYAYTPELDKYGNEQPFDRTTAQGNLNLVQDQQGTILDDAFVMQAGEGAYAPGTFDPLPQAPGEYDMLLGTYLGYGPTTYQGFIAELIANGLPPDQAINEFWATAQDPEDPNSTALMASLPTKYQQVQDPVTNTIVNQAVEGGDWEAPQRLAFSLGEAQMKQVPQAPEYGAVAQKYLDEGVPFPNERYGQGQYSMEAQFPSTWGDGGISKIAQAQKRLEGARATAADPQAIQRSQAAYLTGVREESARPAPERTPPEVISTPQGDLDVPDPAAVAARPWAYTSEQVNTTQGGLQGLSPTPPPAGVRPSTVPIPGMEPTTTGRSANRIVATTPGLSQGASNRAVESARKNLEAMQGEVYTPEARRRMTMNLAMNQLGRTPTQDTLMARQLTNYMMGVYGPRG